MCSRSEGPLTVSQQFMPESAAFVCGCCKGSSFPSSDIAPFRLALENKAPKWGGGWRGGKVTKWPFCKLKKEKMKEENGTRGSSPNPCCNHTALLPEFLSSWSIGTCLGIAAPSRWDLRGCSSWGCTVLSSPSFLPVAVTALCCRNIFFPLLHSLLFFSWQLEELMGRDKTGEGATQHSPVSP